MIIQILIQIICIKILKVLQEKDQKVPKVIDSDECFKIMGFPKNYILHKKSNVNYSQIGNAVSPVFANVGASVFVQYAQLLAYEDESTVYPAEAL